MKRILVLLLALTLIASLLGACGRERLPGQSVPADSPRAEESGEASEAAVNDPEGGSSGAWSSDVGAISKASSSKGASSVGNEPSSSERGSSIVSSSEPVSSQWTPSSREAVRLSDEKALKIKEDYQAWLKLKGIERTIDEIGIVAYYGRYGNTEFVRIGYSGMDVNNVVYPYIIEIAGFEIKGGVGAEFFMFYTENSPVSLCSFLKIGMAYSTGVLTKQDICDLQEYQNYETTGY